MRHFDSTDEYRDAIHARLDEFDADFPLSEIARTTVVTWRGESGLHTLETVEPELRWGWSPFGILEQSPTSPEHVCPDEYLSSSEAAYHVLIADLEDARAAREAEEVL